MSETIDRIFAQLNRQQRIGDLDVLLLASSYILLVRMADLPIPASEVDELRTLRQKVVALVAALSIDGETSTTGRVLELVQLKLDELRDRELITLKDVVEPPKESA